MLFRPEIYLTVDRVRKLTTGNSHALLFCWTLVQMAVTLRH
jgi:hypothetical protein